MKNDANEDLETSRYWDVLRDIQDIVDKTNTWIRIIVNHHNVLVNWFIGVTIVQTILFLTLFLKIYG